MLKNAQSLLDFTPSKLKYSLKEDGIFKHNYERDLHFMILWENGRDKEEEVFKEISSRFKLLFYSEVYWSDENKRANFNRLYSQQLDSDANLKKHMRVGMGPFVCIVFEDLNPEYKYVKSLSGEIFLGNINVVQTKYKLRELLGGNFLHGTSNILEFFHHGSLIFHLSILERIITREEWDGKVEIIRQDLAGANGWSNFNEFFSITNLCSNWVILRNHEFLPDNFWENDKDIDLMCENLKQFVSVANAYKRRGSISAFATKIEGKEVYLDIRYVGDNYFDSVWQQKMLDRKLYKNKNIPILRDDDYFFSLLYHAKLQKPTVKEIYIPRLINLAEKIGLKSIDHKDIYLDEKSASILNGYLNSHGYYFCKPYDTRVYINKNVLKYINAYPLVGKNYIKGKVIKQLAKFTPGFVKRILPQKLKKRITKGI